ncbi:MAG: TAXI family TRAP transporter solute-binding subunit [Proteobacteria bacterium]|nr:TAXI family TRAP transporter solute-binding subunit [Pseudomonadota bacterium]
MTITQLALRSTLAVAVALAMALPGAAGAVEAKKPAAVSISVGPPGTPWSINGAGLCQLFTEQGVRCTTELGGGVANPVTVSKGRTYMGFTMAANMPLAVAGEDPYKEKITNIRGIHFLTHQAVHVLVRNECNINKMTDFKGKPFATQPVGNTTTLSFQLMLAAAGLKEDDLKISRGGQDFGANQVKDRNTCGFTATTGYPAPAFSEVMQSMGKEVKLLNLSDEEVKGVQKLNPAYVGYELPANVYANQPNPVRTIGTTSFLMTRAEQPAAEVYWITKLIFENLDRVRAIHSGNNFLTKETVAKVPGVPLHPGAEAYFKEKGLL